MDGKIVVAASGYFDPLHVGHIEYLKLAKDEGDELVVIVNNDYQTGLKKGKSFMPAKERKRILEELRCVDRVVESIDYDRSVCKTIEMLKPDIFAKGGDRNAGNIPEREICERYGIKIISGLGEKIQSSSSLIKGSKEIAYGS